MTLIGEVPSGWTPLQMLWNCLSHPWRNHYDFFCSLFVCFWLLLSSFVTFFANRKEEEWHMATRGELWHLKSKLSGFIVLGRVKTYNRSIDWVHYCSVWFKQAQLVFSVLGLHWVLFVYLLKCPHAERSDDAKSSECTGKGLCWGLKKVVTNENCFWFTSCLAFIYLSLPGN